MLPSLLAVGISLPALTTATTSSSSLKTQAGKPLLRAGVTAHHGGSSWSNIRQIKRQDAAGLDNQQNGTSYTIDLDIGTPPQSITVVLDTGSTELWVNPTCETSGQTDYCKSFPRFDYTGSSTFEHKDHKNILAYGKGNVTDAVGIGSANITDQIFGLGLQSYEFPLGIIGLAPPLKGDDEALYNYFLDNLVIQGLIDSRSFSLDLRDIDSPDGSIIFGGIDTGKYIGSLEECPILDSEDTPAKTDRYWIYLTGLGMTLPSGESGLISDSKLPVLLDSGGTFSRLPTQVFESIGATFPGARYNPEEGGYAVNCSVADEPGSIDFGFNDKVISVSFKEFIWPSTYVEEYCMLGMFPDDEQAILGDSFLRAAYMVFDQDNRNLHLAQAANCGTNLVAISSGVDAVPSVTGDCTAITSTPVLTGTLTASQTPSTNTQGPSGLASGSGAKGTENSTTVVANLAARETGSHVAAVGAVALAGYLSWS